MEQKRPKSHEKEVVSGGSGVPDTVLSGAMLSSVSGAGVSVCSGEGSGVFRAPEELPPCPPVELLPGVASNVSHPNPLK